MTSLDAYARAVVAGEIPAGTYHRLSCARHLRDMARQDTLGFPFRFDAGKAERFVKFAELLSHYKGRWAGQKIRLEPWERFITSSVFGWVHTETGLRRFKTAFVQVPRKNGKTLLAAVVLLYATFFDGENAGEGYCVATKRDQSKLVFADARKMVLSSGLKARIKAQVASLSRDDTASKLVPLGADHDSTDGLNPSVICVDEMHAMKDRGMLDVMETATGARDQPLILEITTFGSEPVSPWGDQNDYSQKILDGVLVDESFFVFTAHADPEDDWRLPETARKANPNYGISVSPEDLAGKVLKATGIPSAAASYRIKHLNVCVAAATACLSVDGWRKGQTTWAPDELLHEPCYVGIDLASKIDLCCLSFVFPPHGPRASWRLWQHIWTPADTLVNRAHRDRAPYDVWRDQGWLTETPGTQIDHQLIRAVLKDARTRFDIAVIGFDPWHADTLISQLINEDGFPETHVLAVPQTYAGMSSACLKMQAEILSGNVDARGCPVTAWAVSNVVPNVDGKDNLMFAKGKSRGRIDPVIAATIGMALQLRMPTPAKSVYLTRGVRTLGS